MSEIQDLYDRVASGEAQLPDDPHVQRVLAQRALESTRDPDPAHRRRGLEVAGAIGDLDAMEIVAAFLADPLPEMRARAWELGRSAGERGLGVVRDAAGCGDEAIAVEAIRLLDARTDKQSASTMRRLLGSPSPAVRRGAVTLLGKIAGLSVLREVERLLTDPDTAVRDAAAVARATILGEPAPTPAQAPQADPLPALPPPPSAPPAPILESVAAAPQPTEAGLEALREASKGMATERPTAPAPEEPALPAIVLPQEPGSAHEDPDPIPLPAELPTEGLALLRLLGRVAIADRPAVLDRLRRVDLGVLGEALSGYRPGADAARGRGLGIAATALGSPRWVTPLRGLLRDPDALTRAAATVALGGLAGPSLIPTLGALSTDASPAVRASCAWALGACARRLDAAPIVAHWLAALAKDTDPQVQAAASAARAPKSA